MGYYDYISPRFMTILGRARPIWYKAGCKGLPAIYPSRLPGLRLWGLEAPSWLCPPHLLCDPALATALLRAALETEELGPIVPAGSVTVSDRSASPSGILFNTALWRGNLCLCSAARTELENLLHVSNLLPLILGQ